MAWAPTTNRLSSDYWDKTYPGHDAPKAFKDTSQGQKFTKTFSEADQATKSQILNHLQSGAKAGNPRSQAQIDAISHNGQVSAETSNPVKIAPANILGKNFSNPVQKVSDVATSVAKATSHAVQHPLHTGEQLGKDTLGPAVNAIASPVEALIGGVTSNQAILQDAQNRNPIAQAGNSLGLAGKDVQEGRNPGKNLLKAAGTATNLVASGLPLVGFGEKKGATLAKAAVDSGVKNAAYGGVLGASQGAETGDLENVKKGAIQGAAIGGALGAGGEALLHENLSKGILDGAVDKHFATGSDVALENVKNNIPINEPTTKLLGRGQNSVKPKLLGSGTPSKLLGSGLRNDANESTSIIKGTPGTPATPTHLPVSDGEYTQRFNELSKNYDKQTKSISKLGPLAQKVAQEDLDHSHIEALRQLDDEYKNGKPNPSYSPEVPGEPDKSVASGFVMGDSATKDHATAVQSMSQGEQLQKRSDQIDRIINNAQQNGTNRSADTLRELVRERENIKGVLDGSKDINELEEPSIKPPTSPKAAITDNPNVVSLDSEKPAVSEVTHNSPDPLETLHEDQARGKISPEEYQQTVQKLTTPDENPVLKPATSNGEERTSKLGSGVQQKAVENKLTDTLGELPGYNQVNMKDQAKYATDLLGTDEQKATNIALGKEQPPGHILPESVFTAVENKALSDGNVGLLKQLATSSRVGEATAMGQRIRALAERNPDSAVGGIKQVVDARKAAFEKRNGTAPRAVYKEVNAIKANIKKPDANDWSSFVESLKC